MKRGYYTVDFDHSLGKDNITLHASNLLPTFVHRWISVGLDPIGAFRDSLGQRKLLFNIMLASLERAMLGNRRGIRANVVLAIN
jgi:hypothetical protein